MGGRARVGHCRFVRRVVAGQGPAVSIKGGARVGHWYASRPRHHGGACCGSAGVAGQAGGSATFTASTRQDTAPLMVRIRRT